MVNKIIASFFLFDLIVALLICAVWSAQGVEFHEVEIGADFLSFVRQCSNELNNNKIEIPNIPQIPMIEDISAEGDSNWWSQVLDFFINFANGFFTFINAVINILNFFVQTINIIIQLLQFIFILLRNIFTLRDNLVRQPIPA